MLKQLFQFSVLVWKVQILIYTTQFPIQYIAPFPPQGFISSPYESKEHLQEVREIKGEGKYLWFNLYTDYNIIGMSGF